MADRWDVSRAVLAVLVLLASCGGDDSGGGGTVDAGHTLDAGGLDATPGTDAGPTGEDAGEWDAGEECPDEDGDGYADAACGGEDCDDTDGTVHPGATDGCNGVDDDCDGTVDDAPDNTFYRDQDGDGYGVSTDTIVACEAPDGFAELDGDCDDEAADVHPDATEACNEVDDNCASGVDEGCPCTPIGAVDDTCGSATEVGACAYGTRTCEAGGWSDCVGAVTPVVEVCDGGTDPEVADENCDGAIDEGCDCTNGTTRTCRPAGATAFGGTSICTQVVQTCAAGSWPRDCDEETLVGPGTEVCDGDTDEDCDGMVDEGCDCTDGTSRSCGTDTGLCTVGTQSCSDGAWGTCSGIAPVAETCDHQDNDCDGLYDDGVNVNCSWSDSTALQAEFDCLPASCSSYAFGDSLQLGWSVYLPWMPGSGHESRRAFYLSPAVDWGRLGFAVTARVSVRKAAAESIGHGFFGVMMSPRAALGSEANHGMPQLTSGQTGYAALFDTLSRQVSIWELRPSADPVRRGASSGTFGCAVSTSFRDIYVELEYAAGTFTAEARASGCTSASATHTLTSTQVNALIGNRSSYPRYYPGVFGDDASGGTTMLLEYYHVQRSWACQGCPW